MTDTSPVCAEPELYLLLRNVLQVKSIRSISEQQEEINN